MPEGVQRLLNDWVALIEAHQNADTSHALGLLRTHREGPRRRAAEQRNELAALHVWMAPAWQEIIWRAAQRSLAVMCPAFGCSPNRLLALMGSANRGLITRTGSTSHRSVRLLSVASDRPTVPSRVIALSQAPELAW